MKSIYILYFPLTFFNNTVLANHYGYITFLINPASSNFSTFSLIACCFCFPKTLFFFFSLAWFRKKCSTCRSSRQDQSLAYLRASRQNLRHAPDKGYCNFLLIFFQTWIYIVDLIAFFSRQWENNYIRVEKIISK